MESSILNLLSSQSADKHSKHKNNALYNRKQYPLSQSKKQAKDAISTKVPSRPKHVTESAKEDVISIGFSEVSRFEALLNLLQKAGSQFQQLNELNLA